MNKNSAQLAREKGLGREEDTMLRFLVAIDHTVESTFALRAACALARKKGGYLEAVHVLDPSSKTLDYGTGWAVHTYKRELLKDAYSDMEGVIASEGQTCESKPDLKVVFGNVVKEITREVAKGAFDLLFMGSVHPLEGPHQGILLKLLQKVRCPVIIVKHYRPLQKVLVYAGESEDFERAVSKAEFLLKGLSPLQVDLVGFQEPGHETRMQDLLGKNREKLLSSSLDTTTRMLLGNPLQEMPEFSRHYDLVVVGWRHSRKGDPLAMTMLQRMPAPLMVCP